MAQVTGHQVTAKLAAVLARLTQIHEAHQQVAAAVYATPPGQPPAPTPGKSA